MPFFCFVQKNTNDSQQVISNRIQLTFYMYKLIFASSLMSPVFVKWGVGGGEGGHKVFVHLLASSCFHPACKNNKKEVCWWWWWWRGRGGGGVEKKIIQGEKLLTPRVRLISTRNKVRRTGREVWGGAGLVAGQGN